ncbi:antifreeze protein [Mycena alexandri]|uniref:Antifreeze protein n=1 Tax=Mycena alexandri TaxID=1745969 RepID=A0AAD6TIT5_9AGAR|nr:antifreeze protein [Mycena alexandri]
MISSTFTIGFLAALSSVAALGPVAVNLRTAANYAILASTVSLVPRCNISMYSTVTFIPYRMTPLAGDVGVRVCTGLTGFSLTVDSTGQFSTSGQVNGHIFTMCYAAPAPATLTVAFGDMGTAFTDASGRVSPNFNNLALGAIGGLALTPGLYKWTSAVMVGSDITIIGSATDTWIFQVAGTLSIAAGKKIVLAGGALTSNIFWVISGAVTAGAGAHLEGVVLGKTSINLLAGASANSRLLAQGSVALQQACYGLQLTMQLTSLCSGHNIYL